MAAQKRGGAPVAPRDARRRPRGALVAAAATLLAALAVAAIVLANSGKPRQPRQRVAAANVTRAAPARPRKKPAKSPTRPSSRARSSTVSPPVTPASDSSPPTSSSPPAGSPPPSTAPGSPVDAVETFYHLAAAHQYAAAWALADPAFRQELAGYQGLEATMAAERAISFNGADVVNESPNSAVVSVRTTSVRDSGTQNCSGTVELLRAGSVSPGWVLDHIAISCV